MSLEEIKRDQTIKSMFEEAGLENPSSGFTNKLIKKIEVESTASVFKYEPVISKTTWKIMAFLFSSLILFIVLTSSSSVGQTNPLYKYILTIDISAFTEIFRKMTFSIELSPIFKISLLALMVFSFVNLLIVNFQSRSFFRKNY